MAIYTIVVQQQLGGLEYSRSGYFDLLSTSKDCRCSCSTILTWVPENLKINARPWFNRSCSQGFTFSCLHILSSWLLIDIHLQFLHPFPPITGRLPCPVPFWVPNTIGTWGGKSNQNLTNSPCLHAAPSPELAHDRCHSVSLSASFVSTCTQIDPPVSGRDFVNGLFQIRAN